MAIENSGSRFGATSLTALPIQPIHHGNGPIGKSYEKSNIHEILN